MPEWFTVPAFEDLGWVIVVVFFVTLIGVGKLRPERHLLDMERVYKERISDLEQRIQDLRVDYEHGLDAIRNDRDSRMKELVAIADSYRTAYENEQQSRQIDLEAVNRTLEVSELILDIVSSWTAEDPPVPQESGD